MRRFRALGFDPSGFRRAAPRASFGSMRGLRKEDRWSRRLHRWCKRHGVLCDGCYACADQPLARVSRREWHELHGGSGLFPRWEVLSESGFFLAGGRFVGRSLASWRDGGSSQLPAVPGWVRRDPVAEVAYAAERVLWALSGAEMCLRWGVPTQYCEFFSRLVIFLGGDEYDWHPESCECWWPTKGRQAGRCGLLRERALEFGRLTE